MANKIKKMAIELAEQLRKVENSEKKRLDDEFFCLFSPISSLASQIIANLDERGIDYTLNTTEVAEISSFWADVRKKSSNVADFGDISADVEKILQKSKISASDGCKALLLMGLIFLGILFLDGISKNIVNSFTEGFEDAVSEISAGGGTLSKSSPDAKMVEKQTNLAWCDKILWDARLRSHINSALIRADDFKSYLMSDFLTDSKIGAFNQILATAEISLIVLLSTEMWAGYNRGLLDGFSENSVFRLVVCTALDDKVCSDCELMEGEEIPVDLAVEGENIPPFHTLCRCVVMPA